MKRSIVLTALLLSAFTAPSRAEETPNPFVKKTEVAKPAPPAGASFAGLLENILVPPDLLDDWLDEHKMKEDASALRAAVQAWVVEGKAKLDITTLSHGSAGRQTSNNLILERIYPTELAPNGAGVWPSPTAFDTRNLGQDMESGVSSAGDVAALWMSGEHVEMDSSDPWLDLVEKTRQPSDVFLPSFRAKRVRLGDPYANEGGKDPFASTTTPNSANEPVDYTKPHGPTFKPGVVQLVSRFDPVSEGGGGDSLSRVTFYRGAIAPMQKPAAVKDSEISRLSVRTFRVPLLTFSSWLQDRNPLAAITEAWEAASGWRKQGNAHSIGGLSSRISPGTKATVENIEEYIYPTEYEPMNETEFVERWEEGKKQNGKDGVATMKRVKITPATGADAAARPTAFDTRNTGISMRAVLSSDDQGLTLQCEWMRVFHLENSIYHRIQVGQEWIPDMMMPLFSSTGITADIRIQPDQWTLLGATSEYLKTGKVDGEHCLLVFVKVE
jgi:hypothetical protein